MKLMPALPESIFDVCYLIFAITSGVLLLKSAKGRKEIKLFGWMTVWIAGFVFRIMPMPRAKSLPEPLGITPKDTVSRFSRPQRMSWIVPSPPTAMIVDSGSWAEIEAAIWVP